MSRLVFGQQDLDSVRDLSQCMVHITVFSYFVDPAPVADIKADIDFVQLKVWQGAGLDRISEFSTPQERLVKSLVDNANEIRRVFNLIESKLQNSLGD
jgi:hypothetical protein